MKKISKLLSAIMLFIVITTPAVAQIDSSSIAALQAQIAALLQQIQQLQTQLNTLKGGNAAWCHTFNTNLRIGDYGEEIRVLATALQKEGFGQSYGMPVSDDGVFIEDTAAAVVGFQEKYKTEILVPFGLARGTGFVGVGTRKKLNQLYGCGYYNLTTNGDTGKVIPPHEIISPIVVTPDNPGTIFISDSSWEKGRIQKFSVHFNNNGLYSIDFVSADGKIVSTVMDHLASPYPSSTVNWYFRPPASLANGAYKLRFSCLENGFSSARGCGTASFGPVQIVDVSSDPIVVESTAVTVPIEINGRSANTKIRFFNRGNETVENANMKIAISQGVAFRELQQLVNCASVILETSFRPAYQVKLGAILPGDCEFQFKIFARDADPTGEPGRFSPGPATLTIGIFSPGRILLNKSQQITLTTAAPLSVTVNVAPDINALEKGKMTTIAWQLIGKISTRLSLRLTLADGSLVRTISSILDSGTISGFLQYQIPSDIPSGLYKVTACDLNDLNVCVDSQTFDVR